MELTGEHRIPAPREVVWKALHDPDILKDAIKGCERLEFVDDDTMEARVNAKVGPVKATFDAHVEIADAVAPERYTLKGEGKGGVAGFAKGSADVELAEDGPDTTVLTYHAKATIGGKLAQLGSRLVDNTARKYASEFFATLSERVSGPAQEQPAEAPAEGAAPAQAEEAAEAPTQPAPATTPAGAGAAEGEATRPQPAPDAERTPESRTSPTTMLVLAVIIVALAAVAVYALI